MIPRYQKVLFYCLMAGIVTMAIFLFSERQKVRDRWSAKIDSAPLVAPQYSAEKSVTLDLASDRDGTITAVQRQVALPEESSVRARALLDKLAAEYALPRSDHPLPNGAAVDDVFLLKWPTGDQPKASETRSELAVINLRGSFVNQHPSGVQTEMLSVLSMLGTLHENFPQIAEVRFVVDGRSRETMAGHVDLDREYPAIDTTVAANDLQPAP